ncbi:alpha/beta fold hydrolase [Streptomyces sp. RS10V-4]|uniref:alpha/beta fold hydrolase n=1 Tax=Streptomyces rhizoryzae TaxID=2932493 RepID=UPI0020034E2A|nr:alpha/beta fold hydrolase [Streptomyces rhizoryzae]MCK7625263.1 alpha/beta fold hydrolase [Streptomyces rhizoryzae]
MVAPDLSGSGGTTDHGGPLTPADLAGEVLAAADDAGLDRFHLAGHSLGAAIATHLAAHHPERVDSLALHAGWVRTDTRLRAEFGHWLDLLGADARHGTAHFARMLPLAASGPVYGRARAPRRTRNWSRCWRRPWHPGPPGRPRWT